jgi:opacity protein-like surface antigen
MQSGLLIASNQQGGSNASAAYSCMVGASLPICFMGDSAPFTIGWTAGAGFEFAPFQNIAFKLEYLHVSLGDSKNQRLVAIINTRRAER